MLVFPSRKYDDFLLTGGFLLFKKPGQKFFYFLIYNRKVILPFFLTVLFFIGSGISKLDFDFNIESMFPDDDERKSSFQKFQDLFGRDDNLVFLLLETKNPFSLEFMHGLETLASSAKKLSFCHSAHSFLDALECRKLDEMEIRVAPLRERMLGKENSPQVDPEFFRQGIFRNLLDLRTNTAILAIRLKKEFSDDQGRQFAIRELRTFVANQSMSGLKKISITGMPAIRAEGMELIQKDQSHLLPISMGVTLLVFYLIFNRAREVGLVVGNTFLILLGTLGMMGHLGFRFSILSSVTPVILIITGTTYCIHPLVRIRSEGDLRDPEKLARLFAEMSGALFCCCLTTCVGFLSLISSNVVLISEFAWITAGGVMVAFLISITCLPIFVSLGPGQESNGKNPWKFRPFRGFLLSVSRLVIGRKRVLVFVFIAISVIGGSLSSRLPVRAYIFDDFWPDSTFIKNIRYSEKVCSGILPFSIVIQSTSSKVILRGQFLNKAFALTEYLRGQEGVVHVDSLTDMVCQVWQILSGGDKSEPFPPTDSALGMVLRFIMISGYVDTGFGLISEDLSAVQVRGRLEDRESKKNIQLLDRVQDYVKTLEDKDTKISVTGTTPMILESYRAILRNFSSSILIVVGFTVVLFFLFFPSFRILGIALVGNIGPLLTTFGLMRVMDIPLKNSTIVIFGIALGLAVDDTIHFFHNFRRSLREGLTRQEAVSRTLAQTGQAMIVSSIALFAGFLVLLLSEFEAQYLIGFLLSFNVLVALAFDLLFIPAALNLWGPEKASGFFWGKIVSSQKLAGNAEGAPRPTAGDEPREFFAMDGIMSRSPGWARATTSRGEGGRVPPFIEKLQ